MNHKKSVLAILVIGFFFSIFLCAEPWAITQDDPELRNKFIYANNAYFNGQLKLTVIGYSDELKPEYNAMTYHWKDGREVMVFNSKITERCDSQQILAILLHECCHVWCDQYDPRCLTTDGHKLDTFWEQVFRLERLGCYVWMDTISVKYRPQKRTP